MLAAFPGLGAKREELAPKLRLFPIGHYCIYYRVLEDGNVRIERVLHASRDVDALLG
jgi:toxin ParE1/3/4